MHGEVSGSLSTWWTQIRRAAAGSREEREAFVRRYQPLVAIYFQARWRNSPLRAEIEDGVQDVLFECFKESGALSSAEERRPGGFRAFLHGIVRNVASRMEAARSRRDRPDVEEVPAPADDAAPDRAFLREWAAMMMDEAAATLRFRARILGAAAERRLEILRLRFEEDLPIREIAPRLGLAAPQAHKQYAIARDEFAGALHEVVARQAPGASDDDVAAECRALLDLLGA